MKNVLKVSLLGLAHGLSDCAAGFMIGMLPDGGASSLWDVGSLVLLYNVLAFGGQVPAGVVVDRLGRPKLVLALSLCLVAAALLVFPGAPLLAICLAGVAGAFFHVSGGMLALLAFPKSTVGAGLFAAPGVMGLALGGYMAWLGLPALVALAGTVALVVLLILVLEYPAPMSVPQAATQGDALEWHDLIMLVLLLAIAMRSAVWNLFELIHAADHALLLALGLAAMLGKVAGGFLAARLGWRRYAVIALVVATPLLTLGGTLSWTLLPGIFLLQSATPAAVMGMYRLMPRMPATAVGMCFGLAIAVGGVPTMLGWRPELWTLAVLMPVLAAGYWMGMGKLPVASAAE
jgi:MFS transporter, FSR family, fosmidomycin resistance protein